MKIFKFALAIFFSSVFSLSASDINFFVSYDIMTFSTFNDVLKFNAKNNIPQYIQYNSIIPIYLSWENPETLSSLKKLLNTNKLKFFTYKELSPKNKQLKWFLETKKKIKQQLFKKLTKSEPIVLNKNKNFLNILNFLELKKILTTLKKNKISTQLNFNLQPSLFLFNEINNYFNIIKKINTNINFYIFSDKEYRASKKEIIKFIDMLYNIKFYKPLNNYEKRIYKLALLSFIYKIDYNPGNIILSLFPLSNNLPKKYFISSMNFNINKKSYITLYDKKNFFIFNKKSSTLKKFFYLKRGVSLINNDSLVETLYYKRLREPHYKKIDLTAAKYYKFDNGISFIQNDRNKQFKIEKNIILQYGKLIVTYKIKNLYSKKLSFTFVIKNKLSPSLLSSLENLNNSFALYNPYIKNKYTYTINASTSGIINLNTGYGISISPVNKPAGIEIFKNFYNYNYNLYYKFNLYPFETKTITLYIKKTYTKNKKKAYKTLNNLYWGKYEIK